MATIIMINPLSSSLSLIIITDINFCVQFVSLKSKFYINTHAHFIKRYSIIPFRSTKIIQSVHTTKLILK